jgi:hypothetical protein
MVSVRHCIRRLRRASEGRRISARISRMIHHCQCGTLPRDNDTNDRARTRTISIKHEYQVQNESSQVDLVVVVDEVGYCWTRDRKNETRKTTNKIRRLLRKAPAGSPFTVSSLGQASLLYYYRNFRRARARVSLANFELCDLSESQSFVHHQTGLPINPSIRACQSIHQSTITINTSDYHHGSNEKIKNISSLGIAINTADG